MDKLDAMQTFVRIVETGSFVEAAASRAMSATAASRRMAELESHLGVRLLQRTTRKLSLTAAGRQYYERCMQILSELAEAEAEVGLETRTPTGLLRINAPLLFGRLYLAPVLPAFSRRYPEVGFSVVLSDRVVDIVEEGFDLAIQIAEHMPASTWIARRIASIPILICASPEYLARHGTPTRPADLANHNCLIYTTMERATDWTFGTAANQVSVRVSGNLSANSVDVLHQAALAGEGIIREPVFTLAADLREGRLVPLLQEFSPVDMALHVVYASRRHLSAKVRVFADFLFDQFAESPPWGRWSSPAGNPDARPQS